MGSIIHIKTNPSLSPKHIEFNKLVQSIEKLRAELANEEQKLEVFTDYYIKNILPVNDDHNRVKLDMVIALDELSENSRLPKSVIDELEIIIPEILVEVFQSISPDEKTKAIYEKWTDLNYDEMVKSEKEEHLEKLSDFMSSMGIDLDVDDLDFDDPESE